MPPSSKRAASQQASQLFNTQQNQPSIENKQNAKSLRVDKWGLLTLFFAYTKKQRFVNTVFAYTKKHDLLILFFDTSHPASQPSQPASHPTPAREHEGDMQSVFVYVLEHEGSYALNPVARR